MLEAEFARLAVAYLDLIMQAVSNSLDLLVKSVNFSKMWAVLYGLIVINHCNVQTISETLEVTKSSPEALANFSRAVSYLGSNASLIFGDLEGSRGITSIQREIAKLLTSKSNTELLAGDFGRMLKAVSRFVVELLRSAGEAFS